MTPSDPPLRAGPPMSGGWLHRAFVVRQQLEAAVSAAFAGIAIPAGAHIWLFNETDAGYGDVAFATKLVRLWRAAWPGAAIHLATTDRAKQERFTLPAGVEVCDVAAAGEKAAHADLVVSAPGIFDHCRDGAAVRRAIGAGADTPFLYLAEYGSIRQLRDDAFKAAMPAFDAFVDARLDAAAARAAVDPDAVGHRASTGEIVAAGRGEVIGQLVSDVLAGAGSPIGGWALQPALGARSCGLEAGEIGIHIDVELARDGDAPQGRAAAWRDLGHTALRAAIDPSAGAYLGYAHSGIERFAEIVAGLERGRARPIDLIAPGARPMGDLALALFDPARLAALAAAGIGRVEIDDGKGGRTAHDLGAGKRLRLFGHHPIDHADMRRLLVACEAPVMVSGDQSFSDAVSAGKAVVAIEPVYCQTWHLDAVAAIAAQVAPPAQALIALGHRHTWGEAERAVLVDLIGAGGLVDACAAVARAIRADRNGNAAMVAAATHAWAVAHRPEARALVQDYVARALADFDPRAGWSLDPAQWRALAADLARACA